MLYGATFFNLIIKIALQSQYNLFHFTGEKNQESERFSDLPKVTQLVFGRGWIRTHRCPFLLSGTSFSTSEAVALSFRGFQNFSWFFLTLHQPFSPNLQPPTLNWMPQKPRSAPSPHL